MPRFNQQIKDAVFFLYKESTIERRKYEGPCGSGVFVSLPGKANYGRHRHLYAVTCQHVAKLEIGASVIRLNNRWRA